MRKPGNAEGFHWPKEDPQEKAREEALPSHERDTETSVGAGVAPGSEATTGGPADLAAARSDGEAVVQGRLVPGASDADTDDGRRDDDGRRIIDEPGKFVSGGRSG